MKWFIALLFATSLQAAPTVTLEIAIDSPYRTFNLYYGGQNSTEYTNVIRLTNTVSRFVVPKGSYAFAATALDANGGESPLSNEITWPSRRIRVKVQSSTNLFDWTPELSFDSPAATNEMKVFRLRLETVNE